MRGQGATEFLLIVAFILLLILPAGYYIFGQTQEASRVIQADLAVAELAKTADYIYYQSPGAQQTVVAFLPGGIEWADSYIGHPTDSGGTEINLALYTKTGGLTDVFEEVQGEVRGSWPDSNGNWRFIVRKMSDGYVLIAPYELTFLLDPGTFTETLNAGNSTGFTLTLTEIGEVDRTVTLTPQGEIATWITLGDTDVDLVAGGTNTTSVTVVVPSDTAFGYYEGTIQATDGDVEDSVFITIVITGEVGGGGVAFNPDSSLLVNILEPENTTYFTSPLNLTYTVNATTVWCGYSLNDEEPLSIQGNGTLLVLGGTHKIEVACIGEDGAEGIDTEYFTVNISDASNAATCTDLSPVRAFNSTYDDILDQIIYSDDIRAENVETTFGVLRFLNVDWGITFPGETSNLVIHNMSQMVEHYEDSEDLDVILQWQLESGWGATVCTIPSAFPIPANEENHTCTLYGREALENPGKNDVLSTMIFYLPHSATDKAEFVDYTRVAICYGEKIDSLDIISPLNQTYNSTPIWFNVSSNALLYGAWYSLDGAANVSMTTHDLTEAYASVSPDNGTHYVQFYGNDSYNNIFTSNVSFTVSETGPDVTPPVITIDSPLNQTYNESWVWMNVTLNEDGDWAGYSLDGNANQTMNNDSMTHWYYNATGLTNGSHYVVFYANDSSGNMGESSTVYFTINLPVTCGNLTLDYAIDNIGEIETADVQESDDIRADVSIPPFSTAWIEIDFSGTLPSGATIVNATAYDEHYESNSDVTTTLQWYDGSSWADQCILPDRIGSSAEQYDSCDLANVDTVAEANDLKITNYYTRDGIIGTYYGYIDHAYVTVCYTE